MIEIKEDSVIFSWVVPDSFSLTKYPATTFPKTLFPGFLNKNSKIKTLLQNFSIWVAIILLLLTLMTFL